MAGIRSSVLVLLAASVIPLAAGCTTDNDAAQHPAESGQATTSSTGTQSSRPTLTAPKLQPPQQDNKYSASTGRSKVVFDPCTWISDVTIQKAGFEPASRKRGDDLVAEYSFLTCDFSSPTKDLSLNSGNASWDEDLKKVGSYSEPTTVNGREAVWVRDPTPALRRSCQIDVRTKVGFVQIAVDLTDQVARGTDPCVGLLDIATTIEPEIGKDN
ncbi:DUF3558 domain-containing protein [Nocardia sp. NBC_01009]|uniref:DUF3558 domain-containing protein n=1 Tax=Nocardia sp. NBC_01009 TaxID=2975996 RepID=UPI00386D61F1|nr:DUF3558 domain-containing protein [Nocardia sp. NBC_01009]